MKKPNVLDAIKFSSSADLNRSGKALTKAQRKLVRDRERSDQAECASRLRHIISQRARMLALKGQSIDLVVNENVCQFKMPNCEQVGGGRRGEIVEFSRAARRRMIMRMASLKSYPRIFQGLTFADDMMEGKTILERAEYSSRVLKEWKRNLEKEFPGVWGIWKREWQQRKQGELKGQWVPHYHMTWDLPNLGNQGEEGDRWKYYGFRAAEIWVQCSGTNNPDAHRINCMGGKKGLPYQLLDGKAKARAYVAKYCAKVQKIEGEEIEGLEEKVHLDLHSVGRFWGVIGKPEYGETEHLKVTDTERIWLSRILRKIVPKGRTQRLMKAFVGFAFCSRETVKRILLWVQDGLSKGELELKVSGCPF